MKERITSLTSESNSLVFASNQPLHFTCFSNSPSSGGAKPFTGCQGPFTRLRPGGVLVQWDEIGSPGPNMLSDVHLGRKLKSDGLPARLTISPSDVCDLCLHSTVTNPSPRIPFITGSQETVSVILAARQPANYFSFNACIRGPHVGRTTNEVLAFLRSTKVLRPPSSQRP